MPTTGDQVASQTDINNAWIRATPIDGYSPSQWRRDEYGNAIHYNSYGTTGEYGWELDHRKPLSKGGSERQTNIRALHWKANRAKSDKY
jgi:5-methylcytosine-specific restriction endonuclease McrA